jgi:single-strand DNA-binding protein
MASFNKIVIVGYLGRDPEIRYTPQGTAVANFTIATTEKRKDRAGEFQDVTTWFRVSAWGKLAELAQQYLSKGRQVYIEGRLRMEEYTDREGLKRQSLEVTASEIHFLSPKGESGPAAGSSGHAPDAASDEPSSGRREDDDIPF